MKLSRRFERALLFASRLHADQLRKGSGIPYVAHLLSVAGLVLEHGGTEDEAIAALLHDAIEDQGGAVAHAQIRRRFGRHVAELVDGCSDCDTTPKPPWRERKVAYLAGIPGEHPSVRLVSMADKLHNARSTLRDYRERGEALWARFNGGKAGTLWYFRALVDSFAASPSDERTGPLLEELERVVSALEQAVAARDGRRPSRRSR